MKVFALVAVVLVASLAPKAEAGILSFLQDAVTNLGHTALNVLTNAASTLIQTATSGFRHILSETGQYALFQMGNSGQKRSISTTALPLMHVQLEFDDRLQQALQHALGEAEKVVNSGEQILSSLLAGHIQPTDALNLVDELKDAIERVIGNLHGGLQADLAALLGSHVQRRDLHLLSLLQGKLTELLQPFSSALHQQLGNVVNAVQTIAHNVLNGHGIETVLSGLLGHFQ